jgi:hypothetical protein
VLYGPVRFGFFGKVRCGASVYGAVRSGKARIPRLCRVGLGSVLSGLVWYGMVGFGSVRFGAVWFGSESVVRYSRVV